MSTEIERARRAEPAWDEVRERRVLTRVLSERGARARRAAQLRRAGLVGAVLAAAAAIVVVADVASAPERATEDRSGRIALSEGSEIELEEGARVEVATEGPSEVRIVQAAGEARYVVSHLPARRFVVVCGNVEVVVRGTRFVVRRESDAVEVEVEEGRVEVIRGAEHSLLTRGESIRITDADVERGVERIDLAPSEVAPSEGAEMEGEESIEAEAIEDEVAIAVPPAEEGEDAVSERRRPLDVDALLRQADAARRDGRLADASRALSTAIDALGRDPRSATALFTLGRVERTRGRHVAAANAFESAYERDPGAILAEDALAEATVSWADAGRTERARAGAERYLSHYPAGQYLERVRRAAR